ncbi:MAG: hypothetical protein MPW15_01325 [Candidatus Manganitrophus sp.]|nr:hypothetical protein [Candidatus Manganitrophus sp.]
MPGRFVLFREERYLQDLVFAPPTDHHFIPADLGDPAVFTHNIADPIEELFAGLGVLDHRIRFVVASDHCSEEGLIEGNSGADIAGRDRSAFGPAASGCFPRILELKMFPSTMAL